MKTKNLATGLAVLAAALYAVNIPLSKLLMTYIQPTMMAALLYLGAGVGMLAYVLIGKAMGQNTIKEPLTKKELPYTISMVLLDIAAPIFLMLGITRTNSANVSLLNNFEIVATSLIAFFIFREVLSRRLAFAIVLVTLASILLGFEGNGSFVFNAGSLLVLAACTCWGLENNCTKMISSKSSIEIVIIKGFGSGFGSLIVSLILGEQIPPLIWTLCALILGFVAYGLSINFYITAQNHLGAAKTSAYYSIAPFLGVAFSMILLKERPGLQFWFAAAIMVFATVLMVKDTVSLQHTHIHSHTHTHEHRHGQLVHSHEHTHEHSHIHTHGAEEGNHDHKHHDLKEHNHTHAAL